MADTNNACSICKQKFDDGGAHTWFLCGHSFHMECLAKHCGISENFASTAHRTLTCPSCKCPLCNHAGCDLQCDNSEDERFAILRMPTLEMGGCDMQDDKSEGGATPTSPSASPSTSSAPSAQPNTQAHHLTVSEVKKAHEETCLLRQMLHDTESQLFKVQDDARGREVDLQFQVEKEQGLRLDAARQVAALQQELSAEKAKAAAKRADDAKMNLRRQAIHKRTLTLRGVQRNDWKVRKEAVFKERREKTKFAMQLRRRMDNAVKKLKGDKTKLATELKSLIAQPLAILIDARAFRDKITKHSPSLWPVIDRMHCEFDDIVKACDMVIQCHRAEITGALLNPLHQFTSIHLPAVKQLNPLLRQFRKLATVLRETAIAERAETDSSSSEQL